MNKTESIKLWQILKMISENQLSEGDRFKAIDTPIKLIIEYDGCELVYANIMGDETSRDTVTLCSGEMACNYVREG